MTILGNRLRTVIARDRSLTALIVGTLFVQVEFLALGPFSFYQEHDNGDAIYPTVAPLVSEFPLPGLFYPYGMAGTDRLATGHHGGMELFLYWLLPDWLGLTLLTVALTAFAAFYTFRLSRDLFGAPGPWAAITGIFAGFLCSQGQLFNTTMALVPPTLWYLTEIRRDPGTFRRSVACLLGLSVFHGLTGHIHFMSVAFAPILILWLAVVFPTRKIAVIGPAVMAVLLPLAMRWQDFAAAALNGPLSHRNEQPRDLPLESLDAVVDMALLRSHAIATVSFLVTVAAVAAALMFRRKAMVMASPAIRLLLSCLFLQSMVIIVPLVKPHLVAILPLLNGFALSRGAIAVPIFWAINIGAAASLFASHTSGTGRWPVLGPKSGQAVFVAVACFLIYSIATQKIDNLEAYIRTGSFVFAFQSDTLSDLATTVEETDQGPWRAEPIRVEATRLQAYGIETLGGYFTLYPKRFHNYWLALIDPLKTTSPDAYESMRRLGSESFLFSTDHDASPALAEFADIDLLSLGNVRFILSKNPLSENWLIPRRTAAMAWDERSTTEKATENLKANFTGFSEFYIYENPRAARRFFRPMALEVMPNDGAVLSALQTRSLEELLAAAPIEDDEAPGWSVSGGRADEASDSIGKIERLSDRYRIQVDYKTPGLLAGSVSYSPFWKAQFIPDDGETVPLETAPLYHAFIGTLVPAGKGVVEFFYRPPYRVLEP
ncbi:YfhO family protein [Rhodospirillaceae bacterium KN72]|uniref:YfhO family protein n=1 Tax=Pacificispira spongiicola TaxID=2729598 RepID=A0A7Y0HCS4_9PROT|nr:DUF6044 family protein [Pacificispira spongiicola]NMM42905.1 YfhO family protein [Pacificispira spongiicola]